ncbi:UDP-2-acetamido-2,6-beta-L-arabino-hexul-4-ose reductase [Noviherbaspirillum malthae]|uniref:UDP-2-acetamido-2,6-beta-L-arabino-hexul-4-ose reductase n=1 Tax=Noviherbaspirillum malthae TaxID=1260987 RepID=UPI00188FEF7E|nr:NAD-dependent epimerase/dehydratase family protein [Noviherbaspirillum malthae]
MRIVITGADGFIGKNLKVRLAELGYIDVIGITRKTSPAAMHEALTAADCVFHLAGVNRPQDLAEFEMGNANLTKDVCEVLSQAGRQATVVLASSTQAGLDNPYGSSKRAAEDAVRKYGNSSGAPVHIFRLTNVFGKWARPNYNSAVATFCYNITRGLPITINNPAAPLQLVYVDDVVQAFVKCIPVDNMPCNTNVRVDGFVEAGPVYSTTVGEVSDTLHRFASSRSSLLTPPVGTGLVRALYSTYISYLPPDAFTYQVPRHGDPRGIFVEMLKTPDCGQFSYFTAPPGITRGEHYHHSKTEKFLVIKGSARFGFRNIITDETHELITSGGEAMIVETVPGWTHNITNIGDDEMIVMLWANEVFDRERPDTVAMKVKP